MFFLNNNNNNNNFLQGSWFSSFTGMLQLTRY